MPYGNPTIGDDVIDGRDLAEKWRDLTLYVVPDDEEIDEDDTDSVRLATLLEDDDEARELRDFAAEISGESEDKVDPESVFEGLDDALIHEDYFEEYAQQLADDIGFKAEGWPGSYIDWEAAARDLKMDYSGISFGNHTYYTRY